MSEINPFTELSQRNRILQRKAARRQLTSTQVMFAAIFAIGLMLAINFSTRIAADQELQTINSQILQEIELLNREQQSLLTELDFVRSDAFVERWARSEGRMVKDGEVLVIPVPAELAEIDTSDSVEVSAPLVTSLPRPEPWELWWSLFFDQDLPSS